MRSRKTSALGCSAMMMPPRLRLIGWQDGRVLHPPTPPRNTPCSFPDDGASDDDRDLHAEQNQRPEEDCEDGRKDGADCPNLVEEVMCSRDDQPDETSDRRRAHSPPFTSRDPRPRSRPAV